jgi:hypothetical protein
MQQRTAACSLASTQMGHGGADGDMGGGGGEGAGMMGFGGGRGEAGSEGDYSDPGDLDLGGGGGGGGVDEEAAEMMAHANRMHGGHDPHQMHLQVLRSLGSFRPRSPCRF